jgi:pilus assembly protein CpaB
VTPGLARRPAGLRRQHPGLRRLLSAGLAALATAVALTRLAPAPPQLVPVAVAARDIAAGHRLGPGDLVLAGWRPGTAPPDRIRSPDAAVGRVTSGPVPRGSPVTGAALLGPGVLAGQPPDLLAVAVPLTDAGLAPSLRRGDRVDVLATTSHSSSPVVTAAVVLADATGTVSADSPYAGAGPAGAVASGGDNGAPAAIGSAGTVVVGVRLWEAERLAQAEAVGALTLALHPR